MNEQNISIVPQGESLSATSLPENKSFQIISAASAKAANASAGEA